MLGLVNTQNKPLAYKICEQAHRFDYLPNTIGLLVIPLQSKSTHCGITLNADIISACFCIGDSTRLVVAAFIRATIVVSTAWLAALLHIKVGIAGAAANGNVE